MYAAQLARRVGLIQALGRKKHMARIEIPEHLRSKLGPDMKMDVHWIDVKLRSGEKFRRLVVRGGRYITGRANDENGEGPLPFTSADIVNIRRESIWQWPLW